MKENQPIVSRGAKSICTLTLNLPSFLLHCCVSGLQFLQQCRDLFDGDLNSQCHDCPEISEQSPSLR